ncbi:hypothetical protein Vsou_25120 [Vulcanisaeta souniana JCM 11219]|uniref:Uncharacterized protein n=1 Tax=Vulcanisaeta souniana JCM 11219 TaxID=1293586 RepID=A0ABN6SUK8_9CREN|nr:hypothetical protein Vsou_25120 [Vulcanisaeta souniana JCM 11219]
MNFAIIINNDDTDNVGHGYYLDKLLNNIGIIVVIIFQKRFNYFIK